MSVDYEGFFKFCMAKGATHAEDPSEIARDYMIEHNLMPLFEQMTAALMYQQPDGTFRQNHSADSVLQRIIKLASVRVAQQKHGP